MLCGKFFCQICYTSQMSACQQTPLECEEGKSKTFFTSSPHFIPARQNKCVKGDTVLKTTPDARTSFSLLPIWLNNSLLADWWEVPQCLSCSRRIKRNLAGDCKQKVKYPSSYNIYISEIFSGKTLTSKERLYLIITITIIFFLRKNKMSKCKIQKLVGIKTLWNFLSSDIHYTSSLPLCLKLVEWSKSLHYYCLIFFL